MDLNENLWYLIAFFGLFGLCLITWGVKTFLPNPMVYFYKHFLYPLLHEYLPFTSVHAFISLAFLFANIVIVLSPTFSPGWEALQSKIALTAVVNIAPLCIGGRAPIIDTLNVSRNWYNKFHSWLGVVVSIEAVSHSLIAISLRPKSQEMRLSGWIGTTSTISKLLVALSCSFWGATTALRICKMFYHQHIAEVMAATHITSTCQVEVRLSNEVAVYPGCYFYVYFPIKWYPMRWIRYNFTYSITALVFWHPSDQDARAVKDMTFLMSREGSHASAVSQLQMGQSVFIDGPYGKDLCLETYENVVLAAKGIGIAAILPLALDLAVRRRNDNRIRERMQKINDQQLQLFDEQHSSKGKEKQIIIQQRKQLAEEREQLFRERLYRDAVKKVDVFWSLNHNDQIEWASAQLKHLQSMDPDNVGQFSFGGMILANSATETPGSLVWFSFPNYWTPSIQTIPSLDVFGMQPV
ncbi:NADPH oxidase [Metarhizium robertsii]|uniref:NADPH oxidase n=1 Tax=Metarhizium robertsii TaxID=568076 RepID=A0A014N6L9_9HYPO|nr:NADPH oxidase [Metarhizium robertsii]